MSVDRPPRQGMLRHLGHRGCLRLPVPFDVAGILHEVDALPADTWGLAGRDPLVLAEVQSFFAIGHPRGPRPIPPQDRAVLARLPILHRLLRQQLPAEPRRAIVARQAAGGLIPLHRDTPRNFRGTLRLSIQLDADGTQAFFCDGLSYGLAPGEVWAIDNLRTHGILNTGRRPRTSLIVDLWPSPELERLLTAGEAGFGRADPSGHAQLVRLTRQRCGGPGHRLQRLGWEVSKRLRRRG